MWLHPRKVEGDERRGGKSGWESLGFTSWCCSWSLPQFPWRAGSVSSPRRGRLCFSQGSFSPAVLPVAAVAASQWLCCFLGQGALRATPVSGSTLGWGPNPAAGECPNSVTKSPALAPRDAWTQLPTLLGVLSWQLFLRAICHLSPRGWAGNWARWAFGVIHVSCSDIFMPGGLRRTLTDPILQRQNVFHAGMLLCRAGRWVVEVKRE